MPTCPDGRLLRPSIVSLIQRDHPAWSPEDTACHDVLQHYRNLYLQQVLESDRGDLDTLEARVLESMRAAVQAPVIVMSQNRLETKDRLRNESDYRTNLQAEF